MKKMVFNKMGMVVYCLIFMLAIILGVYDCENINLFMATKIICFALSTILFKLTKYLPQND